MLVFASFPAAFFEIARTKGSYCQINIILNYEWYFHRAKYKWHLQSGAPPLQLRIALRSVVLLFGGDPALGGGGQPVGMQTPLEGGLLK